MLEKNYNLNTFWAELIIEELIRNGVDYFCISPGSRSTPLITAVARNKKAKKIICFDERGSAFHALGYAQAKNKPAAVIVTSGTAVANLFPAIVEAFQNNIPMIALTADRPPELMDVGANQTINQVKIFGMYAKWYFNFPCPDKNISPKMVLATIDYAVYLSLINPSGPVHLNCMFREPLEPLEFNEDYAGKKYVEDINHWIIENKPYTSYINSKKIISDINDINYISEIINKEDKGLVSIGRLKSNEEREAVLEFIKKINWPVYADVTSNLRLNEYTDSNIIKHFDQAFLSSDFNKKAAPKTVIHFGGRITSKRFDQFLNQNKPENYIIIKDNPVRYDPVHLITQHIECNIVYFCKNILSLIKTNKKNSFKDFYEVKAKKAQEIINNSIKNEVRANEIFISRFISEEIPDNSCLFLSNSMPIRDMELYGKSSDKNINIGANRGVSGIDGIISSAIGFAAGSNKICTLLIGDLAFIHDLNALATIRSVRVPIVIILINNNGGGIFDFFPMSKLSDIFEEYFITPHDLNFKDVAKTFNINYYSVFTNVDFSKAYKDALNIAQISSKSSLIEVFSDRENNLRIRKKIKNEILDMLEK